MSKKGIFSKPIGFIILCLILAGNMVLAVRMGSASMTFGEFFGGLFGKVGYEMQTVILCSVRLPRVLGAVIAGMGLSVSGVLLQSVTGNELAGPNIIGVNAGAGFCVIFLLWVIPTGALLTPVFAFGGAFLTSLLILWISSKMENTRSTVILAGIAVTALLNAGISFISLLDSDVLASYNHFSIGGLSGVEAEKLVIPAVIVIVSILVACLLCRRIDALCLGDEIALSLGVRVKAMRTICLILASALAAGVVSFAGLLGFVGLVVPHISRRLCGSKTGVLIPVSALVGAILVVLADLLGRVIFAPSEIPVGIIMALIGAPFFFVLLLRRNNHVGIS